MKFHRLGMGTGILVAWFCGLLWGQDAAPPAPAKLLEVGAVAPDFESADPYHRPFKSWEKRSLGGLVLAFFRLRDEASENLLHDLQKRAPAYAQIGLQVVAVNVRHQPEQVKRFVLEHPLDFSVVLDPDRHIQQAYGVHEEDVPLVFVIKRDRTIAGRVVSGSLISAGALEEAVEQVRVELAGGGSGRAAAVQREQAPVVRVAAPPKAPSPKKPSSPAPPRSALPQLRAARQKYERGDTQGAIREAREAVQAHDEEARAHLYLGYFLEMAEDYGGALNEYEKAASLQPDSEYAQMAVARLKPLEPLIAWSTRAAGGAAGTAEGTGETTGAMGETAAGGAGPGAQRKFGQRWLSVGPFGEDPEADFRFPFPPEEEVLNDQLLSESYPSIAGDVEWEKVEIKEGPLVSQGGTGTGATLQLHYDRNKVNGGVVYALTYIKSPEERDVLLKVSSMGSFTLWVNNERIFEYIMPEHPDPADPTGLRRKRLGIVDPPPLVPLQAGWNKVLIKDRYEYDDGWKVDFDILSQDGSRLPDLWYNTEPTG